MPDSQPQEPAEHDRGAAPGTTALLLCNARLADGRTVDVRIGGGRIEAVGAAGGVPPPPASRPPSRTVRVDLTGYLLLPAPAEPHAHYDTALTADPGHAPPTDASRGPCDPRRVQRRTAEAALLQLSHGATALRTHVRVGDAAGLRVLDAVLRARRALRGLADLGVVAVPGVLTGTAGTDGLAVLREAVEMGAEAVGGRPDLDPDPAGHLEAVLAVAAEYGRAVDLHVRGGEPARLARFAALAGGLPAGVVIGPCDGLARLPHRVAARTAEALAASGITVVCLPQGGCGMLRVRHTTPVRLLEAAGVRVAAGGGALRDTANPVGRGDPLEAAHLLVSRDRARPEAAYEAVSTRARQALGLPPARIEVGSPAELLAVRGDTLAGALSLAYSRLVVHRGRVVARTSAVREYCDPVGAADGRTAEPGLPRQSQR